MPIGVEYIDKAVARTGDIVMLCRVLLRIGDEEIAVDVFDAERCEPGRDSGIRKAAASSHQVIVMVEDFDRSGPKVCREQEHAIDVNAEYRALVNGAQRGVGVDGIVDGKDRVIRRVQACGPRRYRSVLGDPKEYCRQRCPWHQERRRGIPDHAAR